MPSPTNGIAFFTRYLPNMGGVEFFTDNLAKQLAKDGYTPIVITTDQSSSEIDRDFEIIRLPSMSLLSGRYPIPKHSATKQSLSALLASRNVRHFVINGRFYPLSRLGAKIAREHNAIPLVIDHSSSYVASPKSPIGFCLAIADHISTWQLKRYKPSFRSVSQRSSAWLERFQIKSQGEIHNAIDSESFREQARHIVLPCHHDSSCRVLRVGFAGRLIPEKGVLSLTAALHHSVNPIELYIAGSGPLEEKISAETAGNPFVHYLGKLEHDQLASMLMQCDVFCFPTQYGEGLPTCLLEAAACGCALVTTNTGGTAEIIPNSDYGIVLDDTAPETIALALDGLATSPEQLSTLRRNIQRHIEENFSWKKTEEELLCALDAVNEG